MKIVVIKQDFTDPSVLGADAKVRQIKDVIDSLVRQMYATTRQMHRVDTPGADARRDKCKATQMQS